MTIRHKELEITPENPFANCQLDRQKYAHVLTSVIENYSDGFVLAINNKWGTGKTTFIRMWNQALKNSNYKTVYFNAWENDFEDNPLTALMGELKSLKDKSNEKQFQSTVAKAAKITKHLAPALVKAVAEKYIDTETVTDALTNITSGIVDIFEKDVEEYSKRKKNISEFKSELSSFIAKTSNTKPVVFIIDELDRCRPNYAVSILEQIKHFFSVPNIVFVLSIDKIQLGNAVCGVYGSENLDSQEYLKRFIDLEYSLPKPNSELYHLYLYKYFNFDDFFVSPQRLQYSGFQNDKELFLDTCKALFTDNMTLRQQERIFAHARLSLKSFTSNNYLLPSLFIFLVYLKNTKSDVYDGIEQRKFSLEQLQEHYFEIVSKNLNEDSERRLVWLEVYLLNSYNNSFDFPKKKRIVSWESAGVSSPLKSLIDKSDGNTDFLVALESIYRSDGNIGSVSILHLVNKINITESFKTQ